MVGVATRDGVAALHHHTRSVCLRRSQVDLRKLKRNGVVVAEALARFMYELSEKVSVSRQLRDSQSLIVLQNAESRVLR